MKTINIPDEMIWPEVKEIIMLEKRKPFRSKKHNKALTQKRLREVLNYDRDTGVFVWRISVGSVRVGSVAGSNHSEGYINIRLDGILYFAHRLAWLYMTGDWPINQTDHKDRNRSNNRFNNLHDVTGYENCKNFSVSKRNTSGVTGVTWDKARGKWKATIRADGKEKNLGRFTSLSEAGKARKHAEEDHGFAVK